MTRSARAVALDVLVRVEQGAFSNVLLASKLREADLDARDRAFATDLVYGSLRWQRLLDHGLAPVLDRRLDALDPPVRAALRLGAYQLRSDVPDHAAVGETVEVAPRRARPFVNAVLRKLATTALSGPPDGEELDAIGVRLSYPDWLVELFIDTFGRADALATLAAGNEPASVTLRPHPGRTSSDALARELEDAGVAVEPGRLGTGALTVRGLGDPAALPAVALGRSTPQDESSQAVVAALAPEPGDRVLDSAAAPGGKVTAIAELVGEDGFVVAGDVHRGRVALIARAASRLGLTNIGPVVADGRALPVAGAPFDRVLVDAPCTGLGVLRRRPEARWRVRPEDAGDLSRLQYELVRAGARVVQPGGTLVYSVCTLTREETIGVDDMIAAELPEMAALDPPGEPWKPWGRGAILLPHVAGTDGMFVLRLGRGSTRGGR